MHITTTLRAALAAIFATAILVLAACGGGDDASPVSAASYTQTAPAGAITVGAGQAQASAAIVTLEHHVGNRISRISISASVSNARTTGPASAAGTRWLIRNGADVIAQGPLSTAPPAGADGATTHEVTVSGGSRIYVEITGHVVGTGAALQWSGASLSLSAAPI